MIAERYFTTALDAEAKRVRYAAMGERNDTLFSASFNIGQIVAAVGADESEVEDALLDAAEANGLTEDEATDTIRSGLTRGGDRPRAVRPPFASREDAFTELALIANAANRAKWPGHRGKRMVRVLFACLRIAYDHGGPSWVALSTRRVGVEANWKNRAGVQRGLHDLTEDDWASLVSPGAPTRSSRYTLHLPFHLRNDEKLSRIQALTTQPHTASLWPDFATPLERAIATPSHDAFHPRALDTTGWRIVVYLVGHPGWHTQAEIAQCLGIARSTVWRWTKPLAMRSDRLTVGPLHRVQVVERDREARLRVPDQFDVDDLDRVARSFCTLGQGNEHRAEVRALFVEQGWLTDDCRWIDTRTGEIRSQAPWLLRRDEADGEGTAA